MLEMTQEVGRRHLAGAGGEFFYFVFYSSLYTLETDVSHGLQYKYRSCYMVTKWAIQERV